MKKILHILNDNNLIYKSLEKLDKKALGTRTKVGLYKAIDRNGYFTILFEIERKSRVLKKDVLVYEQLVQTISQALDHNFKFKVALINAPLCSKAKALLKENGWLVQQTSALGM